MNQETETSHEEMHKDLSTKHIHQPNMNKIHFTNVVSKANQEKISISGFICKVLII